MLRLVFLPFNTLSLFFILSWIGLAASMDKDGPSNTDKRLSSKFNTPNPNLKGLTNIGAVYEEGLERDLKTGKLKQEDVGSQRVDKLREHKKQAERGRNENHMNALYYKHKMRKEGNRTKSRTGREANERSSLAKKRYDFAREQKRYHQGDLEDIHIDAKAHLNEGNFSHNDFYAATKMEYPHESRKLGYHSDGRSNGSSFGPTPSLTSSSSGSPPSRNRSPSPTSRYRSRSPSYRLYASTSSRSRSP